MSKLAKIRTGIRSAVSAWSRELKVTAPVEEPIP
jgi:hypothetical protein